MPSEKPPLDTPVPSNCKERFGPKFPRKPRTSARIATLYCKYETPPPNIVKTLSRPGKKLYRKAAARPDDPSAESHDHSFCGRGAGIAGVPRMAHIGRSRSMTSRGVRSVMTETEARPHIVIATPCYGGNVTNYYALSAIKLQAACIERDIKLSFRMLGGDALI